MRRLHKDESIVIFKIWPFYCWRKPESFQPKPFFKCLKHSKKMKEEYIRLIKQILKTETTLTPLLKIPKLESSEQRVRTKYYYLMDVMALHCIKQVSFCRNSQNSFGNGMENWSLHTTVHTLGTTYVTIMRMYLPLIYFYHMKISLTIISTTSTCQRPAS